MVKAAFELSLSFIIIIVFSVVVLGLAIAWIQGLIPGITAITEDLTQQARAKIQETFQESQNNFAIWPNQYRIKPANSIKMSAGINNNADDGENHIYVINVIPAAASNNVCPTDDINTCTSPDKTTKLIDYLKNWLTVDRSSGTVQINTVGYKDFTVTVKGNAIKGTYIFNVVACFDENIETGSKVTPTSSTCTQTSKNLWSNPQPLTIIVE